MNSMKKLRLIRIVMEYSYNKIGNDIGYSGCYINQIETKGKKPNTDVTQKLSKWITKNEPRAIKKINRIMGASWRTL